MREKLEAYDRPSVKAYFERRFGKMLEEEELSPQNLSGDGPQIVLSPGKDKYVYPAFQFGQDGTPHQFLKPMIDTIKNSSDNRFFSGALLCDWLVTANNGISPATLLAEGRGEELLAQATKFGQKLAPHQPSA